MNKVISFSTRKTLGIQDTKANDTIASVKGTYIGRLPMLDAKVVRDMQDALIVQQEQINELIGVFDESYKDYLRTVVYLLEYLQFPHDSFNPERDKLFIGEDGNTWVVPKEDKPKAEDIPIKLFEFDMIPLVRKAFIKQYMEDEGLSEAEATIKADQFISDRKRATEWLKEQINLKEGEEHGEG